MDLRTSIILKKIAFHQILKKLLTYFSYALLAAGVGIFAFYIFNNPQKRYKLINEYKEGKKSIKAEKIMTNPIINFKYDEDQIFRIKARKASHLDRDNITMFDVIAKGDIGNITAGRAQMNQNGDRLIFTRNPVLVIKNKER